MTLGCELHSNGEAAGPLGVLCDVGERDSIRYAEAPQERRHVAFDRAFGDAEARRDLGVCQAFADGSEHLGLPARDGTQPGAATARLHAPIVP